MNRGCRAGGRGAEPFEIERQRVAAEEPPKKVHHRCSLYDSVEGRHLCQPLIPHGASGGGFRIIRVENAIHQGGIGREHPFRREFLQKLPPRGEDCLPFM